MSYDPDRPLRLRFGLLPRVLATAEAEAEHFARDPFLREALAAEARIGRRIARIGRDTACIFIAALLPVLNPHWGVLYYEALLALFWASGRLRLRFERMGRSLAELGFVLFDILLIVVIAVAPNPFLAAGVPTGFGFRWNIFLYLFLILALATLAYSWRTVWTIGVAVAVIWLAAAVLAAVFGHDVPLVTAQARETAAALGVPGIADFLDINSVQWPLRLQEAVIFVLIAGVLTLKGWRSNQLLLRQARLAAERASLSRYFAPTLVERLATRPDAFATPQTREVAVMFVDIVGFTAMAEQMEDREVVAFLRRYYGEIERLVFEHGGTLDKYLGDGVMATFGTPVPGADDAARALRAGRAIVAAGDGVAPGLRISVGLHFGLATVGDVGPPRRLEFAVLGDAVNVASRLEGATRRLGARLVASDALVAEARRQGAQAPELAGLAPHPGLDLRGRGAPIDVWTDAVPPPGPAPRAGPAARP
jgi:adenylate cyclase